MPKRVVTWNIRHGGGGASKRQVRVADQLLAFDADVLVVTEFRANAAGEYIIGRLRNGGYEVSHPPTGPKENAVLVAARSALQRAAAFDHDLPDQRHLWSVDMDGIRLCGVYMPLGKEKVPYWRSLLDRQNDGSRDIFIGDFNTGNNMIDLAEGATPFDCDTEFDEFGRAEFHDVWRTRNPERREYSWFSPRYRNGFRLDHAFARNNMSGRFSFCDYLHDPRVNGLSDHSALRIDIDC